MEEKTLIVIGAGSRGRTYTDIAKRIGGFRVVGVAEPIRERREYIQKTHGIPDEMCFGTWEPLLAMPRVADAAIISTMDRDHFAPAMAAIEKGYHLLLEKPVAPTPEQCWQIEAAARKQGVSVLVCHVLRYTTFFKALRNVIDSGMLGTVYHIQHAEGVGNVHQSHSFVRGNWGNSDKSSFMLLQKSCHDMDILTWLLRRDCTRASSFGSLNYFLPENAPADAPERCTDGCPHAAECPYNAVKLYYDDKKNSWFRCAATQKPDPTDEDVMETLRTTQYGKCVFKCDNNVVDHQTVNLEYDGGATVSFTMCAFTRGARDIRIMGTKGELTARMGKPELEIFDFLTRETKIIPITDMVTDESIVGGHGGGDTGIVYAFRDLLNGLRPDLRDSLRESCETHMIAFAAEESRLTGAVVDVKQYAEEKKAQ